MDINSINITGNLTNEPEVIGRRDDSGAVSEPLGTKIRIASNYRTKKGDEWVDAVNYINIVVWGGLGGIVEKNTRTGSKVAVTGEMRWREWEQEGSRREAIEVHASSVVFLSPKPA
jgi:single-strand DNA-binding protein